MPVRLDNKCCFIIHESTYSALGNSMKLVFTVLAIQVKK